MNPLRLAALLLFLLLPGSLAADAFISPAARLRPSERLFLCAALGSGLIALLAMALGLAGRFSRGMTFLFWALLCFSLLPWSRRRHGWMRRFGWRGWAALALFLLLGLTLFSPPNRVVFGWNDDGIYADIAALMVREGEIHSQVDPVKEVAPERRDLLFHPRSKEGYPFEAYLYKQFFITDFPSGKVEPQFLYPWPSLMAVFALYLGMDRMFGAVTWAALLWLGGVFLLARRLLGKPWSKALLLLAALSPLTLYFARFSTSEMLTGALFCAACLLPLALRGTEGWGGGEAALCAAFFVLCFLVRIDMLLLILPLFLALAWRRASGDWSAADGVLAAICAAGGALALPVGRLTSGTYFSMVMGKRLPGRIFWFAAIPVAALTLAVLAFRPAPLRRAGGWVTRNRRDLMRLAGLTLAAAFVFLYFIRPMGTAAQLRYPSIGKVVTGTSYDHQNLPRWGWYLSFPGLLLAFAGYWLALRRRPSLTPLWACGASFAFFYLWELRCTPLQMMSMRRLMPVAFPFTLLAMGISLRYLWKAGGQGRKRSRLAGAAGKVTALILLGWLLAFEVNASLPVFGLSEGGDQREVVERMSEVCADGTVLLDYGSGELLGPPLLCLEGSRNAWLVKENALQDGRFPALLGDLGFPDRAVYYVWRTSASPEPRPPEGLGMEEVATVTWREENLETSFTERPRSRRLIEEDFVIYRFRVR